MLLSDPDLMRFTKGEVAPSQSISTERDPLGLTPIPEDTRQRFLRFTLAQKDDALLPLESIVEVMQLSLEDIFPVPDMPSCILGVCSWRGETLWLVDLNHLVGYEPLYQQSQLIRKPVVIVVRSAGRSLGLVVEQVGDVDLFDQASIQWETGLCPSKLEPFVIGYCPQQGGTVIDAKAIVELPLWQSHNSSSDETVDKTVARTQSGPLNTARNAVQNAVRSNRNE